MTPEDLSQAIKTRLHPEPYSRDVQPCGAFDFLLTRRSALPTSRYAFAFRQLSVDNVQETYRHARSEARKLTGSMWLIREVGLYLMICGPESVWRDQTAHGSVDRTGLHNIIVQAVHFVDPETGANHLNRSAWGSVKFGGRIPIPEIVDEVIRTIRNQRMHT